MNILSPTIRCILLFAFSLVIFSCSNDQDNEFNVGGEEEVSVTDIQAILELNASSSVVDSVIIALFQGDIAGVFPETPDCQVTEQTATGFTITFTDCSIQGSENINGTLTVINTGDETSPSFTVNYNNLSVGDLELNGTRSFSTSGTLLNNDISFTIISDMTITLADGSTFSENGTRIVAVVIDFENLQNSGVSITGTWTVVNDADMYIISVTSPLLVTGTCEFISEGILDINKNDLQLSVDFGDGTCDDIAELTFSDGTIEEISL